MDQNGTRSTNSRSAQKAAGGRAYHALVVRVLTVAIALSAILSAQALPKTGVIVDAVARYVAGYQQEFVALVADEATHQRVLGSVSTAAVERRTQGELFSTILENGIWISLHDVQVLDGREVTDRLDVRALLARESFGSLVRRLTEANARYNIGSVTRNFNEPTLALLLFTPAHLRDLSVDRSRVPDEPARSSLVNLAIRLPQSASLVASRDGPVTTRATFVVESDTGRVRKTTITINAGLVDAQLDTTYQLEPRLGIWVPVVFDERYSHRMRRGQLPYEVIEVHTTLTNYRRFETSGRIVE